MWFSVQHQSLKRFIDVMAVFFLCPNLLNAGIFQDRAPISRACCVGPVLYPPIAQFLFYDRFRVECLTYAHRRARPVSPLTSASLGYGVPPTITIPTRRLTNIKRPSRLETWTFLTGTCAFTTRSPTLYRLSYGTGLFEPLLVSKWCYLILISLHQLQEKNPTMLVVSFVNFPPVLF